MAIIMLCGIPLKKLQDLEDEFRKADARNSIPPPNPTQQQSQPAQSAPSQQPQPNPAKAPASPPSAPRAAAAKASGDTHAAQRTAGFTDNPFWCLGKHNRGFYPKGYKEGASVWLDFYCHTVSSGHPLDWLKEHDFIDEGSAAKDNATKAGVSDGGGGGTSGAVDQHGDAKQRSSSDQEGGVDNDEEQWEDDDDDESEVGDDDKEEVEEDDSEESNEEGDEEGASVKLEELRAALASAHGTFAQREIEALEMQMAAAPAGLFPTLLADGRVGIPSRVGVSGGVESQHGAVRRPATVLSADAAPLQPMDAAGQLKHSQGVKGSKPRIRVLASTSPPRK